MKQISCQCCGSKTNNPRFCSRSCAAKINNLGVRRRVPTSGHCIVCGKPKFGGRKSFCSRACNSTFIRNEKDKKIESNSQSSWRTIKSFLMRRVGSCQECGISRWNDKLLSLECDHLDGDISNNCLSNARLLCPNCHSQTPTFRAKNISNPNGRSHRRIRYLKNVKTLP